MHGGGSVGTPKSDYVIHIRPLTNFALHAVLLVVATMALAAPATPTGAHAAWPLPYAG